LSYGCALFLEDGCRVVQYVLWGSAEGVRSLSAELRRPSPASSAAAEFVGTGPLYLSGGAGA
jgi:hypothetical protein